MPEAAEHTGLGENTIRRRVDAWIAGEREGDYPIKGGRSGRDRTVDADDAERVRLQRAGELSPAVTAVEWQARHADGCATSPP